VGRTAQTLPSLRLRQLAAGAAARRRGLQLRNLAAAHLVGLAAARQMMHQLFLVAAARQTKATPAAGIYPALGAAVVVEPEQSEAMGLAQAAPAALAEMGWRLALAARR
jgi:hypothetical protein